MGSVTAVYVHGKSYCCLRSWEVLLLSTFMESLTAVYVHGKSYCCLRSWEVLRRSFDLLFLSLIMPPVAYRMGQSDL